MRNNWIRTCTACKHNNDAHFQHLLKRFADAIESSGLPDSYNVSLTDNIHNGRFIQMNYFNIHPSNVDAVVKERTFFIFHIIVLIFLFKKLKHTIKERCNCSRK